MAEKAKGKRPAFSDDPQVDRLVAMVMALAGEVSVLRERLDTVERLLADTGALPADAIEAYEPSDAVLEEREQWRAAYLDRVLWIVRAGLDEDAAGETPESYEAVVKALGEE